MVTSTCSVRDVGAAMVLCLKVNKAMPKGDRKRKATVKPEGGQAEKKSKPLTAVVRQNFTEIVAVV